MVSAHVEEKQLRLQYLLRKKVTSSGFQALIMHHSFAVGISGIKKKV